MRAFDPEKLGAREDEFALAHFLIIHPIAPFLVVIEQKAGMNDEQRIKLLQERYGSLTIVERISELVFEILSEMED